MILAFIDDTCRVYLNPSDVPDGAAAFDSPEALAEASSLPALNDVIQALLPGSTPAQSSITAANRIWQLLSINLANQKSRIWEYSGVKDKFGNPKYRSKKTDLVRFRYVKGEHYMFDHFHETLAPQARAIVDSVEADPRPALTPKQLFEVVGRHPMFLGRPISHVEKIVRYYIGELLDKKQLAKISFAEYAADPKYRGISLVALEGLNGETTTEEA